MNKIIIISLFLSLAACDASKVSGPNSEPETPVTVDGVDCRKMGSIKEGQLVTTINKFLITKNEEFLELSEEAELASSMFFVSEIAKQNKEVAEAIVSSNLYPKLYKTVFKSAEAGLSVSADDLAKCTL